MSTIPIFMQRKVILIKWLSEIHVQTPISQIADSDFDLLWELYLTKIDNAPAKDALETAIEKGLNRYIFYSAEFQYYGNCDIFPDNYRDIEEKHMDVINAHLSDFIKENKLRKGDVIRLMIYIDPKDWHRTDEEEYYENLYYPNNEGLIVYDGTRLVALDYSIDRANNCGVIPLCINDFPITEYFYYVGSVSTPIVKFNFKDCNLRLLQKHDNEEYDEIYEYQTNSYKIYSAGEFKAEGIMYFDYLYSKCFSDNFLDSEYLKEHFENCQSLRSLFYVNDE
jgi:hypothetical protein